MNAPQTMVVVSKSVSTLSALSIVVVMVDFLSMLMEQLVMVKIIVYTKQNFNDLHSPIQMLMNAPQAMVIVIMGVPTVLVLSIVVVKMVFLSMLMEQHVMVS